MTVGVGSAAADVAAADGPPDAATEAELALDLGPQHPSTHGVLRLRLRLDGDRVVQAEPVIGYMHRGAEKLFEVRDYRQITVLANRHDWLSAFCNELGVVMAVERMLGLQVPARAVWLRTLLAELNRMLNHLMFLGSHLLDGPTPVPAVHGMAARERLQAVLEEAAGGRMHFMFNRVGGLLEEVPAGWTDRVRRAVAEVRADTGGLHRLVGQDEAFAARTRGVGVLPTAAVPAFGVSGPVARASGVDFDLRRDEPYLAYGELADVLRVVTRQAGDCHARFACLLDQVDTSADLVEACLDRLPGGPVNVRLPKAVKAPEGHTYCWTENPQGLSGYYLVSRGERTPWRLKLRSASFNNVQALRVLLPGTALGDLVAILGSMFFVVGDIDR
ncbi:MAG TPA: hypothetical protein VFX70_22400 [Mycobacteriales bacterium]|nr:hypothetical protein [Mycobacteriales bacterium]